MANALGMVNRLPEIPLFAEMNSVELEQAAKHMFVKNYAAGQTLFFAGMPGELMYIVVSGQLEIYRGSGLDEQLLTRVNAGEFSGEGSLVLVGLRSTQCRVAKDSELLVLTKKAFQDLAATAPAVTTKLLKAFLITNIVRLRGSNLKHEASV